MALLGADPGGEFYFSRTPAQWLAENLWVDVNGMSAVNNAPAGRATIYALFSGGGSVWLGRGNFANQSQMTVGWANYNSSASFGANNVIFTFSDVTTHQLDVRTDVSGHLFCTRNGTAIGSASTNVLTAGWHYFEVSCVFATTATGSAVVKVDGVTWITLASVATSTTNAFTNRFYIQTTVQNTSQWYKDIYWRNDGTFMGDLTVNVLYANAAGPSQQFAPSSGSQLSCVQDGITHTGTWPDDTNYIFDNVSGHISDFNPQNIVVPGGGSIKGVVHVSRLSGDVSGQQAQLYTKSGATIHTTATITLGTSPSYNFDPMEVDPNTAAAWTQSGFNAATHGVKIP